MNWLKVKVGDFLIRVKDLVPIEKDKEYSLVTIKLYHKGVHLRKKELGSNVSADKLSQVKVGQFILSGIDARNGAFGIIPAELDGAVVTNDFWHFEIDESIISKEYFLWLTSTAYFDDLCNKASDGTTNRIRLQADRFYTQELLIPEIENQHAVVKELKRQSNKIVALQNEYFYQLAQLGSLNQAILQEAVQGKLVPQNPKDEPATELLKRIKAEKTKSGKKEKPLPPIKPEEIPFEIPVNWVWCRLGEICEALGGYAFDSTRYSKNETKNQIIRLGNVKTNQLVLETSPVFIDDDYALEVEKFILKENDILITMTGTKAKRDYLFSLCLKSIDLCTKKLYLNQRVGCLRFNTSIFAEFINFALKDLVLLSPVFDSATGAANQANIGMTALKEILIPLPPLSEQNRIVAEIEKQLAKTNQLKEHIIANQQATEQLLKALLHQTFEVREVEEVNI